MISRSTSSFRASRSAMAISRAVDTLPRRPVTSVNFVRLRWSSFAISFIAATSCSVDMPAARPSAEGARLSDAMSMADIRSRFRKTLRTSSRVRAPPRACFTSIRVISVQPSRSSPFLRTAIATKIFVVDAIARMSSAFLPKISAPVSASITATALDLTSGRSSADADRPSTPTITHKTKGRMTNELTRGARSRDFPASCALL